MKHNSLKPIFGASALAVALAVSSPAHAQLSSQLGILDLTANGGLNPATGEPWADGDTYHLIYVTTDTTDATATEIAIYNAFVQADADAEGMGDANWFVMGSTAEVNAIDNAVITGPVINIFDQVVVATDADDFYNFNFTADGGGDPLTPKTLAGGNKNVFSGTQGGGTAANPLGGTSVRLAWTGWVDWQAAWRGEPAASLLNMVAISEALTVSGPSSPFQLTIEPSAETPGSFDLEWDSQAGKLYNLRTSTDLTGSVSTWNLVDGDIEATPPTNTYTVGQEGSRRFYAVEDFDAPPPPPLFTADFEEDNGGFTVATSGGTAWEHGAPNSPDQGGGGVSGGNGGSANAWGTNLTGAYVSDTDTSLRSPIIDLTAVTGAELSFARSFDAPAGHKLEVNVIDNTTDTVIANIIPATEDGDINSSAWETIGPVTIPAAALGQAVRIEWRFIGGTVGIDYNGAYLDDVVIAPTL